MISIAIVSQFFFPSTASTAQLITDLAKGLSNRGYNITVFTGTPADVSNHLGDVIVLRNKAILDEGHSILSKALASLTFLGSGSVYCLFKLRQHTPLLIVSNPPYAGLIGVFFTLLRGGEYYFLLQDIFPESAVLSGVFKPKTVLFKIFSYIIYQICRFSKQTIVLTNDMQNFLENKYPDLAHHQKITVIENWAIENMTICNKNDNPFAIKHGLNQRFTILYSGNMGRLHDIECLAEAIYLLRNEPLYFVCIGDGPKRKILENYQSQYHLQNLTILPFQPRESISLTHTACDVSLVSLIDGAEAIVAPCKLYGILSSGRAIVAISRPGSFIDRMLITHHCGVNSPPSKPEVLAHTLRKLACDPILVKHMGDNARQLYETSYTPERAIQQYEALLLPLKPQPLHFT